MPCFVTIGAEQGVSKDLFMLTPKRPPIADHPIWAKLRGYWNLQPKSKNQGRFPLRPLPAMLEAETLDVKVTCVCDEQFCPFRQGSMFFTAPGHTSCSTTELAHHWALWAKLDIGKKHAENVQYGLYE